MITGHSISLFNIPIYHPIQFTRPKPWATYCFIMLAGFFLGSINFKKSHDEIKQKLRSRSINLFLIAIISNFIFLVMKNIAYEKLTIDKFISILVLNEPWTISSILLIYSLSISLMPYLISISKTMKSSDLFFILTLLNFLLNLAIFYTPSAMKQNAVYQILFLGNQYIGFPIIKLSFLCFWAFSLGLIFKNRQSHSNLWIFVLVLSFAGYPVYRIFFLNHYLNNILFSFINSARFTVSIGLAILIYKFGYLNRIKSIFELLGRSSMLVFLLHRVILQIQFLIFSDYINKDVLVVFMVLVTVLLSITICSIKEKHPFILARLKKYGL